MMKKNISLFVLIMYLHGMSGYTMSFHKCTITGSENVYASFEAIDPCGETSNDCKDSRPHFERGSCCEMQYTVVHVKDDLNISCFQSYSFISALSFSLIKPNLFAFDNSTHCSYQNSYTIRPPDPSKICVFRIWLIVSIFRNFIVEYFYWN